MVRDAIGENVHGEWLRAIYYKGKYRVVLKVQYFIEYLPQMTSLTLLFVELRNCPQYFELVPTATVEVWEMQTPAEKIIFLVGTLEC